MRLRAIIAECAGALEVSEARALAAALIARARRNTDDPEPERQWKHAAAVERAVRVTERGYIIFDPDNLIRPGVVAPHLARSWADALNEAADLAERVIDERIAIEVRGGRGG